MTTWSIKARGEAIEHYSVEADTEEEARAKFERGDVDAAWYTEVSGSEIERIDEES